jgi:TetR/AcrR family transcriptional repressor of nem operon
LGPRKTTTRERLITTAAELFRRQGYAQTGVNQIIQEANATSGSFYHFFHIAAVFDDEIFTAAADRSAEPVEELFTILDLYRQLLGDGEFTFASPMAGLSAEVSENHPQVRARLAEIFAAWTDRIETLLRDAGDRLPPTVNRTAIAELVVCAVEGAVLGVRLNRSLEPFNAVVAQLRDYFNLLEARTAAVTAGAVTRRAAHAAPPQSADWRSW